MKSHYNRVLDKVEIIQQKGKYVVIDSMGRIHGRWDDEHHAKEHKNLINSLIEGAENAIKDRKQSKNSFKQYKQTSGGGIPPKASDSNRPQ